MEQRKQKKTASISHNEFQTSENRKNQNRNLTGIMMMILMLICCCCLCLHSKNTCSHHHHHQPYQQRASIRDCSETIILFVRKILWKNIQNIFENQKKTMVSNFFWGKIYIHTNCTKFSFLLLLLIKIPKATLLLDDFFYEKKKVDLQLKSITDKKKTIYLIIDAWLGFRWKFFSFYN